MDEIEIIERADDAEIARWLHDRLRIALTATSGEIAMCIPGGSTPFPILAALAESALEWRRIAVWPGDDRIVPEDHPASNVGKIRRVLEPLGARIAPLFEGAISPRFALTWLGMGEDGHIASLFPNTDPRPDDSQPVRRIMPEPLPPEAPFERLTLTIPALLATDHVMFVIRGSAKRELFLQAARGGNDLPVARLLAAARGKVTCFT